MPQIPTGWFQGLRPWRVQARALESPGPTFLPGFPGAGNGHEVFETLNEWPATRCREMAQRKHPVTTERSIAACFIEEELALPRISAPFDGDV